MTGRSLARVCAALATVLSLVLAGGAQESNLSEDYEQTQEQLEATREQQKRNQAQLASTEDQLRAADEALASTLADLSAAERDLAEANGEYENAKATAEAATASLLEVTDRLDAAQAELATWTRRRDDRVAAAYKYGQVGYLDAFLHAKDFTELVTTGYYVNSVMDSDRRIVGTIDSLVAQVQGERLEAERLRVVTRDQEAAALAAREHVAQITERQRTLAATARQQQQQRARLMSQLQAEAGRLEAVENELEAESQRLAAELAKRSRWRAGAPGRGELLWPTNGTAGSPYGWRTHPISGQRKLHTGVDIGGPTGQPIYAAAEGLVISSGWRGGYGLAVVIDHGGGLATLYAHNSRLLVSEGQVVSAGQQISAMGTTGYSTGPHLHFEVRVDGQPRDPMEWY